MTTVHADLIRAQKPGLCAYLSSCQCTSIHVSFLSGRSVTVRMYGRIIAQSNIHGFCNHNFDRESTSTDTLEGLAAVAVAVEDVKASMNAVCKLER
eukprot:scaffold624354_cov22-Prasinocladus_malaysianus.AAC.1